MSDHYIGLNKGQSGLSLSDFTIGTSSGATDIEVRIADGASLTSLDVQTILEAIQGRIVRDGLETVLTSARL